MDKQHTQNGKPLLKILLTCPNCGNATFFETKDEDGKTVFECSLCGDKAWIDEMTAEPTDEW